MDNNKYSILKSKSLLSGRKLRKLIHNIHLKVRLVRVNFGSLYFFNADIIAPAVHPIAPPINAGTKRGALNTAAIPTPAVAPIPAIVVVVRTAFPFSSSLAIVF
jgi:hypothetical protein